MHRGYATNAWLAAHLRAVRDAEASQAMSERLCNCGRQQRAMAGTSTAAATTLPPVRVKLVCGADLFESFAVPGVWSEEDVSSRWGFVSAIEFCDTWVG